MLLILRQKALARTNCFHSFRNMLLACISISIANFDALRFDRSFAILGFWCLIYFIFLATFISWVLRLGNRGLCFLFFFKFLLPLFFSFLLLFSLSFGFLFQSFTLLDFLGNFLALDVPFCLMVVLNLTHFLQYSLKNVIFLSPWVYRSRWFSLILTFNSWATFNFNGRCGLFLGLKFDLHV